jgi:hypothetical protein
MQDVHIVKNRKILIIGDSHARRCAIKIKDHLSEIFEACTYIKPGVYSDILIKTASAEA